MILESAKELARKGMKMTHKYFSPGEWMTMEGDLITFEDGCQINVYEWVKGRYYLLTGWSEYKNNEH